MNKLAIFSLIIVSNLVTNVQAAEEVRAPEEIRKEMRERVQSLVVEYNRVLIIEDQPNKLTELQNLEPIARNTLNFLRGKQEYGIGGLGRVRQIIRGIEAEIEETRESAMDID